MMPTGWYDIWANPSRESRCVVNNNVPTRGAMVLETVATFGLMYFLFIVGVKMDPMIMVRPGRKATIIALSSFFCTLLVTGLLSIVFQENLPKGNSMEGWLTLVAVSQAFTAFPVTACLLSELKILNSNLGRLALSISMLCDGLGIALSAIAISFLGNKNKSVLTPMGSILSLVALLAAIVYIVRPTIIWILKRSPKGKPINETFTFTMFCLCFRWDF
jgi:Kef-type K+ transport system membrane component KefB